MEHDFSALGGAFAVADAANTALLSVQNKAESPYLIKINRVLLMSASLTAITGVGIQVDVSRLTAVTETGGTAGQLTPMDSDVLNADAQIATYVSVYTGATTFTVGHVVAYRAVNNDEVSLTGQGDVVQRILWTPAKGPLIIKPGQSAAIIQRTASTAGAWIPQIDFTVQRVKG